LRDLLEQVVRIIEPHQESARLDAEVLLAHALALPRHYPYAFPERSVGEDDAPRVLALAMRRAAGEPIAYLTGAREFWSLRLRVSPQTLIPRPETEALVERALEIIPRPAASRVADLGTGSGAIAIAIAHERPNCRILAIELSPSALDVARDNATQLGLDNVRFVIGSWGRPLPRSTFDLIVSNPPYIATGDPHLTRGDVRHEPRLALVAGADGLQSIRTIAREARSALAPGGSLLIEHGIDQRDAVCEILGDLGYAELRVHDDLARRPRFCEARRPLER
jgi:release factor glutamine methyltransferase